MRNKNHYTQTKFKYLEFSRYAKSTSNAKRRQCKQHASTGLLPASGVPGCSARAPGLRYVPRASAPLGRAIRTSWGRFLLVSPALIMIWVLVPCSLALQFLMVFLFTSRIIFFDILDFGFQKHHPKIFFVQFFFIEFIFRFWFMLISFNVRWMASISFSYFKKMGFFNRTSPSIPSTLWLRSSGLGFSIGIINM